MDLAFEAGHATVDIAATLHPEAATTFEQMLTLLDLADEFCRGERLLTLARSPEEAEFQRWFFGEFVRQARGGEAPAPGSPPRTTPRPRRSRPQR